MICKENTPLSVKNVDIHDGFFTPIQDLVRHVVIPYQEKILHDEIPGVEKSHAIENFEIAAGDKQGEFYGMVFQDSDLAKWLEAVAYSLAVEPDAELEARADALIDLVGRAQQEDGYLNTYFTVKEPERRWTNLMECHELYCAGHMIEAAVAYYECTGKDKLLKITCRMADHIDNRFGPGKVRGIPGHEEIELALLRLYSVTKEERYLKLAKYFIDERGQQPDYFVEEEKQNGGWKYFGMSTKKPEYMQNQAPVREQTTVEGHSVRAVYLLTGMADLAARTNDQELFDACDRLWDNMVEKRMYLTAGIGSTRDGEAFTIDYDLPNDTIYAETCASVGLCFFANQMLQMKPSAKYADIMERAFYNGTISGMQLDGKRFFYVNPLEVNPGVSGKLFGYEHVLPKRPGWYACACCPPNLARMIGSLASYAWAENETTIYSHLFVGGTAKFQTAGGVTVQLTSNYPWDGNLTYKVTPATEGSTFTLAVRIPGWCKQYTLRVNGVEVDASSLMKDGYAHITRAWKAEDTVYLSMEMPVEKVYANTAVRADAGCVALMRGPLVYAFESADNGEQLQALRIPRESVGRVLPFEKDLLNGIVPIEIDGIRLVSSGELYSTEPPKEEKVVLRAIPYYTWGNRSGSIAAIESKGLEIDEGTLSMAFNADDLDDEGAGQMRVWMLEK